MPQKPVVSTKQPKVTTVSEWKKPQGQAIEVPSGHTCLVRPAGADVFLREGIIPNSLLPIVREAISTKNPMDDKKMLEMAEDPKMLEDVLRLCDAVVVKCVLEPKVWAVPKYADNDEPVPLENRDSDKLYVDEVLIEDKMFILNFVVGGTRDLERFREEQNRNVELILSGEQVASEA